MILPLPSTEQQRLPPMTAYLLTITYSGVYFVRPPVCRYSNTAAVVVVVRYSVGVWRKPFFKSGQPCFVLFFCFLFLVVCVCVYATSIWSTTDTQSLSAIIISTVQHSLPKVFVLDVWRKPGLMLLDAARAAPALF